MPGIDLAELVTAKVHARLEQMNGELEALVAAAVDEELDRLVAVELAGRTNGAAEPTAMDTGEATKRCRRCGKVKAAADFQPKRATCRECRSAQALARQHHRRTVERPDPLADGSMSATSQEASPAP